MTNDGIVGIKSIGIFIRLMKHSYHQQLCEIAAYILERLCQEEILPVITSAYRPADKGVHGAYRGLDFRSHGIPQELIDEICYEVNERWMYDPNRPEKKCLIYHDVGRGPHFHLQTHPNTKEISR